MDVNCGEWVECMGVVSRRWVWLVRVGGIYRCGLLGVVVRRYIYRFPHTTYPYSSCICSFLQQHPTFCSFLKCFLYILYLHGIEIHSTVLYSDCILFTALCRPQMMRMAQDMQQNNPELFQSLQEEARRLSERQQNPQNPNPQ